MPSSRSTADAGGHVEPALKGLALVRWPLLAAWRRGAGAAGAGGAAGGARRGRSDLGRTTRLGSRRAGVGRLSRPQHAVPGFDAAADYITARLARAGVKPAGDQGGFRQHYELRESRLDTEAASIEIGGRRFALGRDFAMRSLAATDRGGVAGGLCRPRLGDSRSQDRSLRGSRCARQAGARTWPERVAERRAGSADRAGRRRRTDAARGRRRARRRGRAVHHSGGRAHALGSRSSLQTRCGGSSSRRCLLRMRPCR